MEIKIGHTEETDAERYITQRLWQHNESFADINLKTLNVILYDDFHHIQGGLLAHTWCGTLDIHFLWIEDACRQQGTGRQLMQAAEEEARNRDCHMSVVDTMSFQARGFYEKLGYRVYGEQHGYAQRFARYYLAKKL
ncbi:MULTISPECIES: GNAT family N-acetyltransferase [Pantoea]|uniref:GNAT family N-acetyltransferase n=1 Tax=Pantoea TaxID=53335 RepID=UPI001F30CD6B|nr:MULTISPECIES: GNAT family N-acetyltransferase [Pantoea]UIL52809.1 GNAT family N-acetyltransferase [Pantoea agglomerans]